MKITFKTKTDKLEITSHPFLLTQEPNFSGLQASIQTISTTQDGAFFQGSKYTTRDLEFEGAIICSGRDENWIEKQRSLLNKIINPKEEVEVEIEKNGETYHIIAHPISFPGFQVGSENKNKEFQRFFIQLEATDPYIYTNKKVISMQNITPKFSFPLQLKKEEPLVFGEKQNTLIQSIYNDGITESPLEIEIEATQPILNPYLLNVYTGEQIKLNTQLETKDKIIINTGRRKSVTGIRSGIEEPFYFSLDLNSDFIQLNKGNNVYRFGSDSGQDYMKIKISYKERRAGL